MCFYVHVCIYIHLYTHSNSCLSFITLFALVRDEQVDNIVNSED